MCRQNSHHFESQHLFILWCYLFLAFIFYATASLLFRLKGRLILLGLKNILSFDICPKTQIFL
jgi:hypothetical protein